MEDDRLVVETDEIPMVENGVPIVAGQMRKNRILRHRLPVPDRVEQDHVAGLRHV
jgi:hypothetical protein